MVFIDRMSVVQSRVKYIFISSSDTVGRHVADARLLFTDPATRFDSSLNQKYAPENVAVINHNKVCRS